jgi:hypothetical protein
MTTPPVMLILLQEMTLATSSRAQRTGRLQNLLMTEGTILLIVPDHDEHMLSAALRVAHGLNVYHKLDTEIITHAVAVEGMASSVPNPGNMIVFGTPHDHLVQSILNQQQTPIDVRQNTLIINRKPIYESSYGMIKLGSARTGH